MKRVNNVLFVVLVVVGLVAAGCTPAQPTPVPAQPTKAVTQPTAVPPTAVPPPPTAAGPTVADRPLVVAVKTETVTLDPHQNDYDYSQKAQHGAYEALLEYVVKDDGSVEVGPCLAEKWETSDAKVWTISLRKGVKFSDGSPLNAEAVKYNFDRALGMKMPPGNRLPPIDTVEVVDELTLRVNLKNPYVPFSENLTKFFIVSAEAAKSHATADDPWGNKWLFDHAAGTGPYLIESWVKGQTVKMVQNPDYWGGWEGNHAKVIILSFVKDASTRRLLLENGDVDMAEGITFDDLDALSKVPGVVVQGYDQPSLVHMMLRLQGALKDVKVRKAVQLAFDYDGFIQQVLGGRSSYPQGPLPSPVWAFDSSIPPVKQDLEAARKLLAESSYPTGNFTLKIATISPYGWFQPREAQILQANLKDLGITATIQDYPDAAAFYAAIGTADSGPDIYCWTINNSINDPEDNFRRMFHSSSFPEKGGINYIRYANPRFDELLDQALTMTTREERFPLYRELQQILLDDAVAIYSAQPKFYMTMRTSLQGYVWNPFSINNSYEWYDLWPSR